MLELGSAGTQVAGQQDVSVELAVKVVGAEPAAAGHWDATVAGVHRGAHLAAWSITFHTANRKHTQRARRVSLLIHHPEGMHCFVFQREACDRWKTI